MVDRSRPTSPGRRQGDGGIGPLPFETEGSGFSSIRLVRACDDGSESRLMLKIEFRVSLDNESNYLAVQQSTYGLWVRPDPNRRPRPVFRIEYDRDAYNKPAAHVHLHAESMEFGWNGLRGDAADLRVR